MYVYMILTLFLQGTVPHKYTLFFITGFLICHSFLDFLYIGGLHRSRRNSLSGSKQYPLPDYPVIQ